MKRLLYPLYILIIAIILIPKEKLYYTMESALAENHVFLSGEEINNRLIYLDVENAQVVLDNLDAASIERIRITPWIVFNSFTLSSVSVSSDFRYFFPGKIEEIVLTYSILHPLSVQVRAKGDFGQCNGSIDLIEQKSRVVFETTPELRNYPLLVNKLHRAEEGLVYESGF